MAAINDSTVDGFFVDDLRGAGEGGEEKKFRLPLFATVPGELSGDSSLGDKEGNETSDLADVGVTKDCFRDLVRTVPDFREVVDIWEIERSSWAFPLPWPAMMRILLMTLT